MSVTIRPYRSGGWEIDIRVVTPDGARDLRERRRAPMSSRSAAVRWAEGRERVLFERLDAVPRRTRHRRRRCPPYKPSRRDSSTATRGRIGRSRAGSQRRTRSSALHLIPALGRKRLDAIKSEDVQRSEGAAGVRNRPRPSTTSSTVLSVLLKKAVEWEVIERMPCTVKLLPVDEGIDAFHDFDEYERLVEVARSIDPRTLLIVLLGGEAGLRCGEMIALEWSDVDLVKRQLCVRRSDWNGQVDDAEGWTATVRAAHATARRRRSVEHRHLRSPAGALPGRTAAVHPADGAEPRCMRAARRAKLSQDGRSHPSSHVLLAPGDAGCAGEGDSGARGARAT